MAGRPRVCAQGKRPLKKTNPLIKSSVDLGYEALACIGPDEKHRRSPKLRVA